ncbi:hypothetical protein [Burkholderia stagnalis]|uniref:hypothetical protein n=1 Tax=Burkholderia stagnalis TaxID=1503054 RepID=UPI000F803A56|nr:hypothetical protein [Burkholderia stagnalis]
MLAAALEQAGHADAALDVLAQTLEYGQRNGLVRAFVDEGAVLERLIAPAPRQSFDKSVRRIALRPA